MFDREFIAIIRGPRASLKHIRTAAKSAPDVG